MCNCWWWVDIKIGVTVGGELMLEVVGGELMLEG